MLFFVWKERGNEYFIVSDNPISHHANARMPIIKYYVFYYKNFNCKHLKRVGVIFTTPISAAKTTGKKCMWF